MIDFQKTLRHLFIVQDSVAMKFFLLLLCSLLAACTSHKYLGSRQTFLAFSACAIEEQPCPIRSSHLSMQGRETSLDGSYRLQSVAGEVYRLSGSVKLEYDVLTVRKIRNLDLTFVFFQDDLVVQEEIVRVRGNLGEYLEFSKQIKAEAKFESTRWAWYRWRATE